MLYIIKDARNGLLQGGFLVLDQVGQELLRLLESKAVRPM
jgi:hypothetical protein